MKEQKKKYQLAVVGKIQNNLNYPVIAYICI